MLTSVSFLWEQIGEGGDEARAMGGLCHGNTFQKLPKASKMREMYFSFLILDK